MLLARDGFRERGALGHLSFWGPAQVWPIWPFVWKTWKYASLMRNAPSKIYPLWCRIWFCDCLRSGVGKHFLRRATLTILLLPRPACSYLIYYTYNRYENLKVLHELSQNEGNKSHFRLSKNAVSNETSAKKLDNSNLIDKTTLT